METVVEGGVGCRETNPIEEAIEEAAGVAGKEDYADSTREEGSFTVSEVKQN